MSVISIGVGYVALIAATGWAGIACCLIHVFIMVASCRRLGVNR